MRRFEILCAMAFLCSLCVASTAKSAELSSCADIRGYLAAGLPDDPWATYNDLNHAIRLLSSSSSLEDCPAWAIERMYWERAHAVRSFADNPEGKKRAKSWYEEAARCDREYLEWFLNESITARRQIFTIDTKTLTADADFQVEYRRWLRRRVGNVIAELGSAYEKLKRPSDVLQVYQDLADDNANDCAMIFPDQVVNNWYKHLRSMPEYKINKTDVAIQHAFEDPDTRHSWSSFRAFLSVYVRQNKSTEPEWKPCVQKIDRWLAA